MKKLFVLIFIGTVTARLSDEKCKEYYREPNDKNVDLINKFPHMGLLGYLNRDDKIKYNCPATLISESYALAPAFCFTSSRGHPKYILFGTSNLNDKIANQKLLNVTETLIHPKYSESDYRHSVVLVKFSPSITPGDNVRPGCLYTKSIDDKESLTDLLWDMSGSNRKLLEVDATIIPTDSCKESYKKQITIDDYSHLCTRRKFSGDYIRHMGGTSHVIEDKIPKIVALDNFGPKVPSDEYPDVTTKIFNYLDWIEENVWKK